MSKWYLGTEIVHIPAMMEHLAVACLYLRSAIHGANTVSSARCSFVKNRSIMSGCSIVRVCTHPRSSLSPALSIMAVTHIRSPWALPPGKILQGMTWEYNEWRSKNWSAFAWFSPSPPHERAPYRPGHPAENCLTDYRNGKTDTDDSPFPPYRKARDRYVPYFPTNRDMVRLILIWKQSNQR